MSNCAKCGQTLKEDAKFCGECGAPVRQCARCGELVKEGAAYCGKCGGAVNEAAPTLGAAVSPAAPVPYPVAAQAPATLGYVRLTLGEIGFFFGQIDITILIDGNAVRTIQMNETADLVVPAGRHTIELVQVYHSVGTLNIPVTRRSDLELDVAPGTLTMVTGTYGVFSGKFGMDLG